MSFINVILYWINKLLLLQVTDRKYVANKNFKEQRPKQHLTHWPDIYMYASYPATWKALYTFKRESCPTEQNILINNLIDHVKFSFSSFKKISGVVGKSHSSRAGVMTIMGVITHTEMAINLLSTEKKADQHDQHLVHLGDRVVRACDVCGALHMCSQPWFESWLEVLCCVSDPYSNSNYFISMTV